MKKFDQELERFRNRLVEMANLAEKMVRQAVDALENPLDSSLTDQIAEEEHRLDLMQLEIDREAIRLLTIYSPVASDLRVIMSITRITAELERMGDHTVNMSESLLLLQTHNETDILPSILRMADVVIGMVHDAINAFSQSDIDKARATISGDNVVDALNDQIVSELLSLETVRGILDGAKDIAGPLGQLLLVRSLERIADQATNVSEEVVYMIKGDDIRHSSITERDVRR
jgi:phosphate transport system protein